MTKIGYHVQVLHDNDTFTMQEARFIASCQVSSCIHKSIFIQKEGLLISFHFMDNKNL